MIPTPPMASLCRISILVLALSICSPTTSCRKVELKTEAKLKPVLPSENATSTSGFDPSRVKQLSWHPRVFIYKGFLSNEECDHLISLASSKLESSREESAATTEVFLARGQDETVEKIEERISAWTFLPKGNGEELQVSHTKVNESYAPQYDYYPDRSKLANGGQRVATIVMSLSDVAHGGEITFPNSELEDTRTKDVLRPDCASTGYAVKPSKGDALLLFNLHPNATTDGRSLHGGCVVLDGKKWSATKWIHVRAFDPGRPASLTDGDCTDEDDNCSQWAATGECQKNPVFMLGTPDYYGSCRKSCGAC